MPKKHRTIEGVGALSIMELKAQLYQSQEELKKSREWAEPDAEYQRAKKKLTPKDAFSVKGTGVDARDLKDKLELKAVNDGAVSYAALERKAELYNKLIKGELSDEEDKEKYCVDFFRKGLEQDELKQPQNHDAGTYNKNIEEWPQRGEANGNLRFEVELKHAANARLVNALKLLQSIKDKYSATGST